MTEGQREYLEEVEKWSHVVIPTGIFKKRGTLQILRVLEDTSAMLPDSMVALRDERNSRVFEKTLHWCRKNLALIDRE